MIAMSLTIKNHSIKKRGDIELLIERYYTNVGEEPNTLLLPGWYVLTEQEKQMLKEKGIKYAN